MKGNPARHRHPTNIVHETIFHPFMRRRPEIFRIQPPGEAVHDRTAGEEQHGLEEGMREHVVRRTVGRRTPVRGTCIPTETVEYAKMRLMSYWAMPMVAASNAVSPPTQATMCSDSGSAETADTSAIR